jgi:hypothetical protein
MSYLEIVQKCLNAHGFSIKVDPNLIKDKELSKILGYVYFNNYIISSGSDHIFKAEFDVETFLNAREYTMVKEINNPTVLELLEIIDKKDNRIRRITRTEVDKMKNYFYARGFEFIGGSDEGVKDDYFKYPKRLPKLFKLAVPHRDNPEIRKLENMGFSRDKIITVIKKNPNKSINEYVNHLLSIGGKKCIYEYNI